MHGRIADMAGAEPFHADLTLPQDVAASIRTVADHEGCTPEEALIRLAGIGQHLWSWAANGDQIRRNDSLVTVHVPGPTS